MRRFTALLVVLPVMLAGGIAAHWLAYLLAAPEAGARRTLLLATGHAYQTRLPVVMGVVGGTSLVLLAALVLRGGSLVARLRLHPVVFLVLPMVGFAVQEFSERVAVGYEAPWHVWLEPTFWRGMVLQVPFGLLAFIVAMLLLRAAVFVERVVARRRRQGPRRPRAVVVRRAAMASTVVLPRLVRAGDALRFRGPPAAAFACR